MTKERGTENNLGCIPLAITEYSEGRDFVRESYIFMIDRCPPDWKGDMSLPLLCQRDPNLENYFYLLDLPVFSLKTNRSYANMLCARCHGDTDQLENLNVTVECNWPLERLTIPPRKLLTPAYYKRGLRQWYYEDDSLGNVICSMTVDQFKDINGYIKRTGSRRCQKRIETCTGGWYDKKVEEKCQMYTLLVQDLSNSSNPDYRKIVYKNPHCAICNYVQDNKIRQYEYVKRFPLHYFDKWMEDNESSRMKFHFDFNKDHQRNNFHCPIDESYNLGSDASVCVSKNLNPFIRYSKGQEYLSEASLILNVIFLAVHIGVHIALRKLRDLPGKNLLSLSCALFFAQVLFLVCVKLRETMSFVFCAAIGVLIHWFYLAAFFWMNVIGFYICQSFAGSLTRFKRTAGSGQQSTFRWYSLYAWGFPTLIVVVSLSLDLLILLSHEGAIEHYHLERIVEFAPAYGDQVCWISNPTGLGIFLALPTAVLFFGNLVMLSITVCSIIKQRRETQATLNKEQPSGQISNTTITSILANLPESSDKSPSASSKQKIQFVLYFKLALIMGLGWIFGLVASFTQVSVMWYPFIVFNGLQGTFIFFAFTFKRKVYYMLYHCATNRSHPADTSSRNHIKILPKTSTSRLQHKV